MGRVRQALTRADRELLAAMHIKAEGAAEEPQPIDLAEELVQQQAIIQQQARQIAAMESLSVFLCACVVFMGVIAVWGWLR